MNRIAINTLLFIVTVALLSLNWILRSDPAKPNVEVLPNMVDSIPYDAFDRNPNFRDGKTLREPVAGTVIRASLAPAKPTVARGAIVYANYCEACHGPAGKGDGRVAQRGFPMPASLLAEKAMKMTDDQIFKVITEGQGNMPPYAAQIDRSDRRAAIAHVRKLQGRSEVQP